ncbi:F-box domain-containing protein [Mycena sanguinolenta]|uniref:F-box domain-containing protein n=1 Tax=Mycena sanguinolenta TaxID=230812 RepID=A0A8H7CBG1_9AGAR|nr:F-box domain-containing protein [Mycena sanguinolenta]
MARIDLRMNELRIRLLEGKSGSETAMQTLRRQNASLHATDQLCRSILSPLRRLPAEILSFIFLLSTPTISEVRYVPWYEYLLWSPWTLGRVCRRWRSVALTSPALWSFIIIRNTGDEGSEFHSLPMLEAQLTRSGTSPLDIVFDYESFRDDSESGEEVAQDVLEAFARHSSRWKSLYITATQFTRLSSVRGRLPLLEKLAVWGRDEEAIYGSGASTPPVIAYFSIAPRLRSVEVDEGFPFFDLPWDQLTRYEALGPWGAHISALRYLKNAELCSLTIAHEADLEDPYTWRDRTVQLLKLRQLKVTTECFFHGIEDYWVWPKWLRVPNLTELAIPDGLLHALPQFQQASMFSLTKLHIIVGCPEVEALRRVLLCNPDISELMLPLGGHIRSRDFTHSKVPALLDLLTIRPHDPRPDLLPKLETLVLHLHENDKDADALGKMIASRWRTTRLHSVHAVDIGPELTPKLNRMKSEGMSVFIRSTQWRTLDHNYGDDASPFQLGR